MSANAAEGGSSQFVTAPDGLKLHVQIFGPRPAWGAPIVCLPGLARTSADFTPLAQSLSGRREPPRRVVALDYRGRGRSDHDPNPANYNLTIELSDLLTVITALELAPAVFIGTSRGGILAMLLAAARPDAIAGVVLNDIGPVIEVEGLARIKSYVGRLPTPASFSDAAAILRRLFAAQFPKLSEDEWMAFARRSFEEDSGRLVPTYDPKIAMTLEGIDLAQPLQPLWAQFDALAGAPMMVIRGANSDLLSEATVAAMRERRTDLIAIEVPDQGHAPFLSEPEIIARIDAFIRSCDARGTQKAPAS
jgi:pimeloyl-ACP methyl ester carboxylesterase